MKTPFYFLHLLSIFFLAVSAANAAPTLPSELSGYIKDGLIAFWDGKYNATNAVGELCHDSSASGWLDLSGSGHDAKVASAIPPAWGGNYFNPSNCVDGVVSKTGQMTYTPNADFLDAINNGHFTYQACFKVRTWMENTAFFGCRDDKGGTWGMRTDVSGNITFAVKGGQSGIGSYKNRWLAGCIHSFAADGWVGNSVMDTSPSYVNFSMDLGNAPTTGGGRIGGYSAMYTIGGDYELYAGRVYNRTLTGVEMAYNAAIDQARYMGYAWPTLVNVSSYSSTHVNYGTATPTYDALPQVATGAAQTFSISGVAAHPFDDELAYVASATASSRALYLGMELTTIDSTGAETTVQYPKTTTSVDTTVSGAMFATWKWRLQHRYLATAAKGGSLRIGDAQETVAAYTNWYTAADAAQVTVTAVPDEGFAFSAWEGDFSGEASSPTMTVTMSAAKTLNATFVRGGKGDGSTYVWKGTGTGSWLDGNNWDQGFPPLEGDRVVISPNANATITVNAAPPHLLSFVLGGGNGTATVQFQNWDTVLTSDEVTINDKGVMQPYSSFTDTEASNRVAIVCSNFTMNVGGKIDASGKGWVAPKKNTNGCGPGAGQQNRGGAGYGGQGGFGYNVRKTQFGNPYGSLIAPLEPGSGAGQSSTSAGGAGGGAVTILASNHIKVNGSIRADGYDSSGNYGGGSGGGVYLSCKTFEGAGTITARGGAATGGTNGGGGGGRIAIVWSDTVAQKAYSPTPILHAGARRYGDKYGSYPSATRMPTYKNQEHQVGTPGTVYLTDDSFYPGTIWSKCSGIFHFGAENGGAYELDNPTFEAEASANSSKLSQDIWFCNRTVSFPNGLTLPKYAHVVFTNCTVQAKSLQVSSGCFDLRGNSKLTVDGDAVVEGTGCFNFEAGPTNGVDAATWNPWGQLVKIGGKLQLKDTAVLYPASDPSNGGSVSFDLGKLEVAAGASINGVSCGFGKYDHMTSGNKTSWGPGASGLGNVGPAYGGYGGGCGTQNIKVYGDAKHPTFPGTDGGRWGSYVGGWGGGLFHAKVKKSVTLDGTINMNGQGSYDNQSCGSSGGGVYLECKVFKGSGSITANGAGGTSATSYSGSGGGGRIAVVCTSTNFWQGTMTAAPGTNAYTYTSTPTEGTVYVKVTGGLQILLR